ncbi:MAG: PspA/IM30 family protein [Sphaerochaetaceae bacterium]
MGVFSRFMDIVNSNINALLDKAEDPEKMIRLMLQEVEDTIIELKASCAANIANKSKAQRLNKEQLEIAKRWLNRAELALSSEKEDLAKEALLERKRALELSSKFEEEIKHYESLSKKCQEDIEKLEQKLTSLKEKHHTIKEQGREAKQESRFKESNEDPFSKFEQMERQVDRMTQENDYLRMKEDLESKFATLEEEKEIEEELQQLRRKIQKG